MKSVKLPESATDHLLKVQSSISGYYEQPSVQAREPSADEINTLLERGAYADLTKSPLAEELVPWTTKYLGGKFRREPGKVTEAAAHYTPLDPVADPAALRDRVRALAAEIAPAKR